MVGEIVATGYADLWDGQISQEISYNEKGQEHYNDAWTGTDPDGTAAIESNLHLGTTGNNAWCGGPFQTDIQWLDRLQPLKTTMLTVYALSEELTVYYADDFNRDGDVDGIDFLLWQQGYGKTSGATTHDGDANSDFQVNDGDLITWHIQRGSSLSSLQASVAAIPEPATAMLLTTAILLHGIRIPCQKCRA